MIVAASVTLDQQMFNGDVIELPLYSGGLAQILSFCVQVAREPDRELGIVSEFKVGVGDADFGRWKRSILLWDYGRILVSERVDVKTAEMDLRYCAPCHNVNAVFESKFTNSPGYEDGILIPITVSAMFRVF